MKVRKKLSPQETGIVSYRQNGEVQISLGNSLALSLTEEEFLAGWEEVKVELYEYFVSYSTNGSVGNFCVSMNAPVSDANSIRALQATLSEHLTPADAPEPVAVVVLSFRQFDRENKSAEVLQKIIPMVEQILNDSEGIPMIDDYLDPRNRADLRALISEHSKSVAGVPIVT